MHRRHADRIIICRPRVDFLRPYSLVFSLLEIKLTGESRMPYPSYPSSCHDTMRSILKIYHGSVSPLPSDQEYEYNNVTRVIRAKRGPLQGVLCLGLMSRYWTDLSFCLNCLITTTMRL